MKALILAGGLGTRLRSAVPDLPKPMAPINGRPFLEYLLDRLIRGGIDDITLSIGYRAEAFVDHFGDRYRSAKIRHVVEDEPLGTGGAIALALGRESRKPWLVLNGDTLLDIDYKAYLSWYEKEASDFAMVLRKVPDVARYGSVLVREGRVTGFLEKGASGEGVINSGIYILRPSLFGELDLSGRFSLETEVLQAHTARLSPRAFVSEDYFIDIGIPSEYDRAQKEFPGLPTA